MSDKAYQTNPAPILDPGLNRGTEISMVFQFRWPVRQVGNQAIEVLLPTDPDGHSIINLDFARSYDLTDNEIREAAAAAARAIAIVK